MTQTPRSAKRRKDSRAKPPPGKASTAAGPDADDDVADQKIQYSRVQGRDGRFAADRVTIVGAPNEEPDGKNSTHELSDDEVGYFCDLLIAVSRTDNATNFNQQHSEISDILINEFKWNKLDLQRLPYFLRHGSLFGILDRDALNIITLGCLNDSGIKESKLVNGIKRRGYITLVDLVSKSFSIHFRKAREGTADGATETLDDLEKGTERKPNRTRGGRDPRKADGGAGKGGDPAAEFFSATDPKAWGSKMKIARKKADLTQRQLADKVGTSEREIRNIENGVHSPRLDTAGKIANAIGGSIMTLLP
ncbi:MAG: helix-turn-helix transcriptional regulator [Pseudomonadota bacterium]